MDKLGGNDPENKKNKTMDISSDTVEDFKQNDEDAAIESSSNGAYPNKSVGVANKAFVSANDKEEDAQGTSTTQSTTQQINQVIANLKNITRRTSEQQTDTDDDNNEVGGGSDCRKDSKSSVKSNRVLVAKKQNNSTMEQPDQTSENQLKPESSGDSKKESNASTQSKDTTSAKSNNKQNGQVSPVGNSDKTKLKPVLPKPGGLKVVGVSYY